MSPSAFRSCRTLMYVLLTCPQFRIIAVLLSRIWHLICLFGLLGNFRCHKWQIVEKSAFFCWVTCGQTIISIARDKLGYIEPGLWYYNKFKCLLPSVSHCDQSRSSVCRDQIIQIHFFFLVIKLFAPGRFLKFFFFLTLVLD